MPQFGRTVVFSSLSHSPSLAISLTEYLPASGFNQTPYQGLQHYYFRPGEFSQLTLQPLILLPETPMNNVLKHKCRRSFILSGGTYKEVIGNL